VRLSVIILSFNSADSLPATLASLEGLTDDIHVVDSGSSDKTVEIARDMGAKVSYHPFSNYGVQRNWAIDNIVTAYDWQLHLDADERLTPALKTEILDLPERSSFSGYIIPRMMQFLGRILRHGAMSPTWHMRLFLRGQGRCETREYDQHFYCSGQTKRLNHAMIDDIRMTLSEWTLRHNRWSDAEVRELTQMKTEDRIAGKISGNVIERKRSLRVYYMRLPLFGRAFCLFFYRFVIRAGFLDGTEGLIFWVLQTFWFRFLIDAKLYEKRKGSVGCPAPDRMNLN
jgi:glycosyltransferase involved in cell wall biosynthesis